ncbi:MAG: RHS repeat-associated core domain-containing protein [Lachnospiraceae bacterium]|nr:RHS repeat-associated core domain-containing protein [Lachnospiraceae bacterium]
MTNLQGDVTSIINDSGTVVGSYVYDAWGKATSITGTIAQANPIRYRGYYFDDETGFYYLRSRYYDPEICRFVNADSFAYAGANREFISFNLFAYCLNNSVKHQDQSGSVTIETIILVGSILIGVGCAATTGYQLYKQGRDIETIIMNSLSAGAAGFALVYTLGESAYALYYNISAYLGYTPITEIGTKTNLEAELQGCADAANSAIDGNGSQAGTAKHVEFAKNVNELNNDSLRTEVSYMNGVEVPYGTKGSIRFDVIQYNGRGVPINAWDFKTGNAILTNSRISLMHLKSGLNIPIKMIK